MTDAQPVGLVAGELLFRGDGTVFHAVPADVPGQPGEPGTNLALEVLLSAAQSREVVAMLGQGVAGAVPGSAGSQGRTGP